VSAALEQLLRHPGLWRAGDSGHGAATRCVASGNKQLDDWLPGGGWPVAALTELLCGQQAIGGFALLVPLLARMTASGREVALVAPPFVPHASALAERGVDLGRLLVVSPRLATEACWAAEQILRSGAFAALLLWMTGDPDVRVTRRLQLAAEQGGGCAFLLRRWPARAGPGAVARSVSIASQVAADASPAVLRLRLAACGGRVRAAARGGHDPRLLLQVQKCRGRAPPAPLAL